MAFINDYLSDEEMEMFKKLNIPYPHDTGKHGIIGYSPNAYKLKALRRTCTIDRAEEIYFFYCGTEKYDMENIPKDHYFYLIWNKELGNDIVTIILEQIYGQSNDNHKEHIISWKIVDCYSKYAGKITDEKIITKIKEALSVYDISGHPNIKADNSRVKFDF